MIAKNSANNTFMRDYCLAYRLNKKLVSVIWSNRSVASRGEKQRCTFIVLGTGRGIYDELSWIIKAHDIRNFASYLRSQAKPQLRNLVEFHVNDETVRLEELTQEFPFSIQRCMFTKRKLMLVDLSCTFRKLWIERITCNSTLSAIRVAYEVEIIRNVGSPFYLTSW